MIYFRENSSVDASIHGSELVSDPFANVIVSVTLKFFQNYIKLTTLAFSFFYALRIKA